MTVTCRERTATLDEQFCLPWENLYFASELRICVGSIQAERRSDTRSVLAIMTQDEEMNPYECVRSSHTLAFWDHRDEDIYSFNDGEPV
jgi:hypothetical protein